jgi:hypothetical protein
LTKGVFFAILKLMKITTSTLENGKWVESVTEFTPSPELEEMMKAVAEEEKITRPKNRAGLSTSWCSEDRRYNMGLERDDECVFRCFPADGECSCGIEKHHVHCKHGFVTQIG